MINAAILGYGTVGAGVFGVLKMNSAAIARRAGDEIRVKYVLDLREFPGDPAAEVLTHDYKDILDDPGVSIVVETMGGLKPAYDFTKQALLAGKNVCTSNKELVAEYGVELLTIAREHSVNYLFEASCGGGIPIIRTFNSSLTAEEIDAVTGILNGTTNYILTKMRVDGQDFGDALKEAQERGYAEKHPEADVEGWDACRKIAILSSLAYGNHVSYKEIPTEGITNIEKADIAYAEALGMRVKLLAVSRRNEKGVWALVAPMLVAKSNMLYYVDDVLNAVFVHGNALGDAMFYGSGAGSLPTASAVAGDVVDCARHLHKTIRSDWSPKKAELLPPDGVCRSFFVRFSGSEAEARDIFGNVKPIRTLGASGEFGFVTEVMSEKNFHEKCSGSGKVIKSIRIA